MNNKSITTNTITKKQSYDSENKILYTVVAEEKINNETGEGTQEIKIKKTFFNPHGAYNALIGDMLAVMNILGDAKERVFTYIITHKHDNIFSLPFTKITKDTGVTKPVIIETFKRLESNELIVREGKSLWLIKPTFVNIINNKKRVKLITEYQQSITDKRHDKIVKQLSEPAQAIEFEAPPSVVAYENLREQYLKLNPQAKLINNIMYRVSNVNGKETKHKVSEADMKSYIEYKSKPK